MSYVFDGRLCRVTPYYFQYKTHVKQRWVGRTIPQVFESDLGQSSSLSYEDIKHDRLQLQIKDKGKPVIIQGEKLITQPLRQHDIILNYKHIHEPPIVWSGPISIIYQDPSLIVVNKPSGIPTHPSGNFRYNSVTEIVKAQLHLESIFPCHRLDKATSGILMLATTSAACSNIQKQLQERKDVKKEYIARVKGKFPPSQLVHQDPVFLLNSTAGYIMPGRYVSIDSSTTFTRLKYNLELDESIVSCEPHSGKMHQIRIHLRNLGFPIVNDKLYNPGESDKLNLLRNNIELKLYKKVKLSTKDNTDIQIDIVKESDFESKEIQQDIKMLLKLRQARLAELFLSPTVCVECKRPIVASTGDGNSFWLHARKYEVNINGDLLSFSAAEPDWACI